MCIHRKYIKSGNKDRGQADWSRPVSPLQSGQRARITIRLFLIFVFFFPFSGQGDDFSEAGEQDQNPAVTWYIHTAGMGCRRLAMVSMAEGWGGIDLDHSEKNPLLYLSENKWSRREDFNLETFRTHVLDATSAQNVWVCSYAPLRDETYDGLRINVFNGSHWQHFILEYGIWPHCLTLVSDNEVWLGGNSASLIHIKDNSYSLLQIPVAEDLQPLSHIFKIQMQADGTGWAVGSHGLIARYENGEWTPVPLPAGFPQQVRFYDMDLTPENHLWVIGEQGTILNYDGAEWRIQPVPVKSMLYGIDMVSGRDGWIVGDEGLILRYNGREWQSFFSPAKNGLYDIRMFSPTEGWICGQDVILKLSAGELNLYRERSGEINPHMDENSFGDFAVVDVDGDHIGDRFFLPRLYLYKNEGSGVFTNTSAFSGIAGMEESFQAFAWGDIDHDFDNDLYLINRKHDANKLFINDGAGRFEPAAGEATLGGGYNNNAYLIDIDNDNDLDIYLERWVESSEIAAGDYIYLNNGYGEFELRKTDMGKKNAYWLVLWGDLDGDLDLDAVFPRLGESLLVYRNDGKGNFEDFSGESGILDHFSEYPDAITTKALLLDADLDGDLDLLVFAGYLYLFYNDGNAHFPEVYVFEDALSYPFSKANFSCDTGDINNDGKPDFIFSANTETGGTLLYCFLAREDGTYLDIADHIGIKNINADHLALCDPDDDGDLDLYITRGDTGQSSLYYENRLNNRNYLYVSARGVVSNTGAVGAQIRIFEAGHLGEPAYLKGHKHVGTGASSHNINNAGKIHFGLGSGGKYDVEVLFPSGKRQVKKNVLPGGTLLVYEYPFGLRHAINMVYSIKRILHRLNYPVEIIKLIVILLAIVLIRIYPADKLKADIFIKKGYFQLLFCLGYLFLTGYTSRFTGWYSHFSSVTGFILFLAGMTFLDRRLSAWKKAAYIGPYKIIKKIAEGGMGLVYKARNIINKSTVALKILHPRIMEDEQNKRRFLREGKIIETLEHPQIVKVLETGEISGRGFICMEYLAGFTLASLIKESAPLSPQTLLSLILPVCEALAYIHRCHVIHRDIKSENIFILEKDPASVIKGLSAGKTDPGRWNIKLMDFGLAHARDFVSISHTNSVMGTLAYMAPEHFLDTGIDTRTDIYALGILMYEALSGKLPHSESSDLGFIQAIIKSEYRPVCQLNPRVPVWLSEIIGKMLCKDPNNRYQTVEKVIAALTGTPDKTGRTNLNQDPANAGAQDTDNINTLITEISHKVIPGEKPPSAAASHSTSLDDQSKGAEAAQKDEETCQELEQAYQTMLREKSLVLSGDEKKLFCAYTSRKLTERWQNCYKHAKELSDRGDNHGAQESILECLGYINQALLLLDEEQKQSYLKTFHVEEIIHFMAEV